MIQLKFIRENPERVKEGIAHKNEKIGDVDRILQVDEQMRTLMTEADELKNRRNQNSKKIGELQKAKQDASALIREMKAVSTRIKELDGELKQLQEELDHLLLYVPNLPHESVPVGKSENDNVETARWSEPKEFTFQPKEHVELAESLGLIDFKRGAKVAGSGFPLYTGAGARLERALLNFMLDLHGREHGFTEIFPPFVVVPDSMRGTGQIPKLAEDMYHIEKDDAYLIPTAEVPLTNIHRDEILSADQLPRKFVAYSACFRREAGSYGKDTRGMLRLHQFNKVEMVLMTRPEKSYEALEQLRAYAEKVLQSLGLHYRTLELCTADLSFAAAKCYDLEVWAPGENRYLEVSSVSNFEEFQARRAMIRYRNPETGKPEYVHTLNGSGVATPRLLVALLETWQQEDGSVLLPEVLHPYMGGITRLEKQ